MSYKITVTSTGSTTSCVATFLGFTGAVISGTDGSHAAVGTGTTPAAGSFTTTVNGDVVVGIVECITGGLTVTQGTGFTIENNYTGFRNMADEFQIQSAHAAINPGFTLSAGAGNWACVGGAFKKSSGTPSFSQKTALTAASPMVMTATSVPTVGDLLVLGVWSLGGSTFTVTDSSNNTWLQLVQSAVTSSNFLSLMYVLSYASGGIPGSLASLGCGTN